MPDASPASSLTPGPCEKCGWALCTTGAPCVAQRVWAMPVPPSSVLGGDVGAQLGDARRAAGTPQPAVLVEGHGRTSRSRGTRAAASLRPAPGRCCGH